MNNLPLRPQRGGTGWIFLVTPLGVQELARRPLPRGSVSGRLGLEA